MSGGLDKHGWEPSSRDYERDWNTFQLSIIAILILCCIWWS